VAAISMFRVRFGSGTTDTGANEVVTFISGFLFSVTTGDRRRIRPLTD
jgi:hypothetical protein